MANGRIKRLRLVNRRTVARVFDDQQPRRGQLAHIRLLVGHRRVIHVAADDQDRALDATQPRSHAPADERIGRGPVRPRIIFAHLLDKHGQVLGLLWLGEEPPANELTDFFHRQEVKHQPSLDNLPPLPQVLRHQFRAAVDHRQAKEALWLLHRHLEANHAAHGEANQMKAVDVQLIQQGKNVGGKLGYAVRARRASRTAVSPYVHHNHAKLLGKIGALVFPGTAVGAQAMQQEQRLTCPLFFIIERYVL